MAATLIPNGTLSVVDPEQAGPESISDPTQNQPPDPGKRPSIPVPTGIPPGPIGQAVDPDNPPRSSVPLPRPDEAIQALSAQVDNEPIDTAGATAGIAFRPRYVGHSVAV